MDKDNMHAANSQSYRQLLDLVISNCKSYCKLRYDNILNDFTYHAHQLVANGTKQG